tara:strand:+ start:865 stop:1134 length:270 start_codon:yes stop_codon:yes gene_type:complete
MFVNKGFKTFDDALLDRHPELKNILMPSDQYPELQHILKNKPLKLPHGSFNTRVIINEGEIVERVYKTLNGRTISLFSKPLIDPLSQAA